MFDLLPEGQKLELRHTASNTEIYHQGTKIGHCPKYISYLLKASGNNYKRRQKNEGRGQKFTCSEEVFTPKSNSVRIPEDGILNQRDKLEIDPSAFCPLPTCGQVLCAFQGESLGGYQLSVERVNKLDPRYVFRTIAKLRIKSDLNLFSSSLFNTIHPMPV